MSKVDRDKVRFRMANPDDTEAMLEIYAPFILNTHTSFEKEVPEITIFEKRIQAVLKEAPWLIAESNGCIMGYAYASEHRPRAAYRHNRELSVYIHESYRGIGLGVALYWSIIELLRLQGYANVLAGVALPNAVSVRFHQRLGFTKVGTYLDAGFKFDRFWSIEWWQKRIRDIPIDDIISIDDLENSIVDRILLEAKRHIKM